MASGKTLQSTIEISGVLSPSLQAAIKNAVNKLEDMSKETLESAGAAEKLCAEISTQESVLKSLKKGYADYVVSGKESSEEAEKLADKIQELSGELDQNKQRIKDAENAADKLDNSFDEAKESAEDASDGFTVMKGALANLVAEGISAAVEGLKELASTAMETYQEYDGGADTIIAKTGATGEAAESLAAVYKDVSKSVAGDFGDIGTAVGEINTRFGLTGDDLENLSVKFLKFAELNGTDVNSAVDSVQKSLAAFGLESSEAGNVLDTMNKVGQDTGISMDVLSDLIMENASSFSQMGLDIHQAASFLGDVEKSGVSTKVAMTALSKASQYAAEEGKPLTKVLEETTDQMANAKTDTEALQIAYDVFGKKAGAKIYEACKNGSLNFDELSKAMENNAGSIDTTYEATQDGMDKIKLAIQGVKADIGDTVASFFDENKDKIVSGIEWVSKNVPKAFSWLKEHLPEIGIALGSVGAVITAMKWGSIVSGVGKAVGAFKGIGTALAAVPAPVLAIIAVVAALAAAFTYLWKNNEDFRNKVTAIWEELKGSFSELGGTISSMIGQIMPVLSSLASSLMTAFMEIAEALLPVLLELISSVLVVVIDLLVQLLPLVMDIIMAVLPVAVQLIQALLPIVVQIVQTVLPILVQLIQTLLPVIMQIVQAVLPVLVQFIQQLLPIVMQIVQMVLPVLVELIQTLVPIFLQIIQAVLPVLIQLINTLLPFIMQIINAVLPVLVEILNLLTPILNLVITLLQPILDLIVALVMPILNLIMTAITPLIEIFLNLIMSVLQPIMPIITALAEVITSVLGSAIQGIQPIIQALTSVFQGLIDFITGVFSGNWSKAWDGVVKVFGGLWDGLVAIVKAPINAVIGLINKAIGALNGISVKIPDWVPVMGGKTFGINLKTIPMLAAGGFTDGISIAGEEAMEAVISFNPAYRKKNISIWERAGQLLGVLSRNSTTGEPSGEGLTSKAGELLTLDNFSLGSLADGTNVVIYYDFSNFTWSPQIHAGGTGDNEDDLMARLRAHEAEFFDWLEEFIEMREVAQYA